MALKDPFLIQKKMKTNKQDRLFIVNRNVELVYILTSVVVSANEADIGVAFCQSYEAFVAAVQRTARKPASTVWRLAVASRCLLGRTGAVPALDRLVLPRLGVVWVVVAVVAQSRWLLRLACLPLAGCTQT